MGGVTLTPHGQKIMWPVESNGIGQCEIGDADKQSVRLGMGSCIHEHECL